MSSITSRTLQHSLELKLTGTSLSILGIFYFFELHDYDKNKKLDGLELFVALTDHHERTKTKEDSGDLLEEEVELLVDNLLEEHDITGDGYIDFMELMNTRPDSHWNKLGRA